MPITEIRIKLMMGYTDERLKAFCSITFDKSFVINGLKIIKGNHNGFFVAMPSKNLKDPCPKCRNKNDLQAGFCSKCGWQLDEKRAIYNGRVNLHSDIAHPIDATSRKYLQGEILKAYYKEIELYNQPGYVCRYDDYGQGD